MNPNNVKIDITIPAYPSYLDNIYNILRIIGWSAVCLLIITGIIIIVSKFKNTNIHKTIKILCTLSVIIVVLTIIGIYRMIYLKGHSY